MRNGEDMSEDTASVPDEAPLTLYLLHALGASARSFDRLADRLAGRVRVVGIDLPGSGPRPTPPRPT